MIPVAPGVGKTDRPAGTHNLIVTVDHVTIAKQPNRETVKRPIKILHQVRGEVRIQVVPRLKRVTLSRQVKQAQRVDVDSIAWY